MSKVRECEIFKCACGSPCYLEVSAFNLEDYESLYFTITQGPMPLLNRIIRAIRLIFKGNTWVKEVEVEKKDVKRLKKVLDKYLGQ